MAKPFLLRRARRFLPLLAPGLVTSGLAATAEPLSEPLRPHCWAQPLEVAGVPNCYRVTSGLLRGGQPSAEGLANLQSQGVRSVINLRYYHSDRFALCGSGMNYFPLGMKAWRRPRLKAMVRFLRLVSDPAHQPVFIHCQHGADRTGLMCAIYRMVICGWQREAAVAEMLQGGFRFHVLWTNLVEFLQRLDVAELRHFANLNDSAFILDEEQP